MKIRPEKNSGLIFTNAQVVFINAKIALSITLLCAVLTYDFHLFTVADWYSLSLLWSRIPGN